MSRKPVLVAGLALACVLPCAQAQGRSNAVPLVERVAAHASANDDDHDDGCQSAVVVCVGKGLVDAATGAAGDVLGGAVGGASSGVMNGVVSWAAEGAASLLNQIAKIIDRSTRPALGSEWFERGYAAMIRVAITLAAVFLLLAVGHAILRQQAAILLRALSALPLALLMTFAAVTLVQLALAITDWMTASVLQASGEGPAKAFHQLGDLFVKSPPQFGGFVAFLSAVLMTMLALAVWIELALREAAVYVAVAFLPLTFVAIVWKPTAIWCRRLTEGLAAVILSKFALAVAFTLAAGAMGQPGPDDGGMSAIVAGGAVLLIAAFSPWVLFRLLPMTQAASDQDITRQQVGGAARSAPGATMAVTATRMLMSARFGPAGSIGMSGGGGAPTPPVAPSARRGSDSSDVPVAVIPEPEPQPRTRPDAPR